MATWSKRFDVPIALPDGSVVETLDQARRFLLGLPAERHRDADVTAAIDAVLMAAEGRGPVMHANVGIARVINGLPKIPESNPPKERSGAGAGWCETSDAGRNDGRSFQDPAT